MGNIITVDYFDIGQRLQKLRKDAGYTQVEVADRAGISVSYYGNIERGKKVMSLETFIKVCAALDASADYVLTNKIPDSDSVVENIIAAAKRGGRDSYLCFLDFMKKMAHSDLL
ncbi:MAG: helix-turn-helix domain-containing protein [Candidatus Avilachnospira sp.]|jgi:transcriptional regulator with XRE-family HTH domain